VAFGREKTRRVTVDEKQRARSVPSGGRLSKAPVVIVGAGHGGVQVAASLRDQGYEDDIVLLSDEPTLPYQRPPLSKTFLKGETDGAALLLRGEPFYRDQRIDLRLGARVTRLDRAVRKAALADGGAVAYSHLVLATGARQRRLDVPGVDLPGIFQLRNIADATSLRERIKAGLRVVVIGAGFIGLEVAAASAELGAETTVVEIARPMGRAVSPIVSGFYADAHRARGVRVLLGVGVSAIEGSDRAEAVVLSDGEILPADLILVGVGVTAEDALAREAGLECANGVIVDAHLLTSDPTISAIGDCAAFPHRTLGSMTRLESIQNAVDQARCVAARIAGKATPYDALAWFWSDQGDLKLMIAGLSHGVDEWVVRGDPATRAFSTFGFRKGTLAVVESVNRPGDHAAAKRILGTSKPLTPAEAGDATFDIRALARK
jgi:3-phenylpropionate/trans-cinnamate dioxygenase ferredoxin reductase component